MSSAKDPPRKPPTNRYAVLLVVLSAIGLGILIRYGAPKDVLTQMVGAGNELHRRVVGCGAAAAILFVAAYVGLMTTLWVPAWPCTIAGSFLFGLWKGMIYALTGATLGATAVFLLGRAGLGGLNRRSAPFVQRLEAGFRDNAFYYLIALRAFPFVPFAVVNLAAALLGLQLRTFMLATIIGILPSTFIYALIGRLLEELLQENREIPSLWSSPIYCFPLVGLAFLAIAPVLFRYVMRRLGRWPYTNRPNF